MIWIIYLLLVLVSIFLYKFVLKPWYYISLYAKNKNVVKYYKFIPVLGPFALLKPQLQQYGDVFYDSKKMFEYYPNSRALVFNLADRAAISIFDPELIQEYYQKKEDNYVKYELTYKNKARVFGNGVAFAEGAEWKKRRMVTTALMNFDFFEIILPKIKDTAKRVIDQLQFKDGKTQFHALDLCSKIAGQAIVKCFFGTDLHDVKFNGEAIAPAVSKFVSEVGALDGQLPILLFGVGILKLGLTENHREINRKIKEMRAFGRKVVFTKIKSAQTDKEMNFIKYIKEKGYLDSNNQVHLTPQEVLDQFFIFFVGGMDTTAHLLHMCLYYFAKYPEIQQRLREQIKDIGQDPDIPTINKYKQLDNFINEANRHYGFMNSIFPREAIKDHFLGDIKIYKGTVLTLGWLSNFYNSEYFENPTVFNPDRWNKPLESHYEFTPFSAGKRTCIGKNLALIEIKLVLIKFLKECRLKIDPSYNIRFVFRSLYQPEQPIIIEAEKLSA